MRRVLFVDDEPQLLDALRNILRKQRDWDKHFATSAAGALALMQDRAFDVVVSDVRMPVMDGARFLAEVKRRHPETVRIVLSGHADREAVLRALTVSHQYLTKPCDTAALCEIINHIFGLQGALSDPMLSALAGALDRLPAVGRSHDALVLVVSDPDSSVRHCADVVAQDVAATTKVLQIANSGYFGLGAPVVSIPGAVTLLGMELIANLADAGLFRSDVGMSLASTFSLEEFQDESLVVARLAREIAIGDTNADEAFATGFMHDLGQVVLALGHPEEVAEVAKRSRSTDGFDHRAEREVLGYSHAEAGAYLLGIWGLPPHIVTAVGNHHRPRNQSGFDALTMTVHMASGLIDELAGPPARAGHSRACFDLRAVEEFGLSAHLSGWRESARRILGESPLGKQQPAGFGP